jgi:hypothetical protein
MTHGNISVWGQVGGGSGGGEGFVCSEERVCAK